MEFFWIIVSNIFTGAIVYLILSLKIERSSPSMMEQRLKREMNEIMTEFNSAAERNINILESKIKQVRNISQKSSDNKHFDYLVPGTKMNLVEKKTPVENSQLLNSQEKVSFFENISHIDDVATPGMPKNSQSSKDLIGREVRSGKNLDLVVEEEINLDALSSEENPQSFFNDADDKYAAVGNLFKRGYSVDEISKFSGIPAGEIGLILNLNR